MFLQPLYECLEHLGFKVVYKEMRSCARALQTVYICHMENVNERRDSDVTSQVVTCELAFRVSVPASLCIQLPCSWHGEAAQDGPRPLAPAFLVGDP